MPIFPTPENYQRYKVSKVDSRRSPTASTSKAAGANNQPGMVGLFKNVIKFVHHDDPPRFFRDVLFLQTICLLFVLGKSGWIKTSFTLFHHLNCLETRPSYEYPVGYVVSCFTCVSDILGQQLQSSISEKDQDLVDGGCFPSVHKKFHQTQ